MTRSGTCSFCCPWSPRNLIVLSKYCFHVTLPFHFFLSFSSSGAGTQALTQDRQASESMVYGLVVLMKYFYVVLRVNPGFLLVLDKCFTEEPHLRPGFVRFAVVVVVF